MFSSVPSEDFANSVIESIINCALVFASRPFAEIKMQKNCPLFLVSVRKELNPWIDSLNSNNTRERVKIDR